jgi:hypothetical protein
MPTNDQPQIFFHLGFPKTGSTFLQRLVFPYIPNIHFFKKHDFKKFRTLKPRAGHKYFFTYEKDVDIKEAMDQIKEKFPENAYLILVFRPHYKWIVSKYKNYIRKFGHLRFSDYFTTDQKGHLNIGADFYTSRADYARKLFNDRVLILNFEELKSEPEQFMRKIYNFMGLQDEEVVISNKVVKPSFSDNQLKILRNFNNLYRFQKLKTPYKVVNQVHYKYRHFLLHIVAFFARFAPIQTEDFNREISSRKEEINAFFKEDWENMKSRFA